MYRFTTLTGLVKHLKVRRLFACVLLLAVVGISISKAQQPAPADLAQIRARAEQADPEAQNSLGNIYTNGALGVKVDHAEALAWYRKAGERGFAPAQFNLGLVYEMGRGVPADERQAFKFYLMAAEQGFAAAQFNIGNMYSTGRGVGQDLFEANLWYKQAAEKGVVEAQFNLGLGYEAGRGVKKDEVQAARWYRLAADRGFSRAQYNLGLLYEDGRGVTKNEATAASYYRAAAEQGFAPAQNNYGVMISEGRGGLAKDSLEAYVWLSLAAEKGANPAARDFVARSLSAEQLVAANRMVAERKGGGSVAPVPAVPVEATAVAARPAATPDTANATRIAELTDALNRARLANAQYAEANQRLELEKAQLAQELSQPTETGKLIDQLRDQSRRLAAQVESLTIEKEVSQREASVLTAQLKDAQTAARQPAAVAAPSPADTAKFKDEITALTTQLAQANAELNQQRQANQRLTQSNTELLEKSKTAVVASRPASGPDSARYPVQENEKDAIIAGLQRDIIRLNDEVKRSTRELTAVNLQLRSARNQVSGPAVPTPASDQTAQLVAKADQAAQEASRLQEENIRLSARVADLEKQPKPAPVDATLAPRLAQAQQELQQLNARLTSENASLAQAQARVAELEKQLSFAQQQSSGTSADIEKLRTQLTAANQSLQENVAQVASLNEANQRLTAEVATAKQAEERIAAQSREQLVTLQKDIAEARASAAGLTAARSENEKLTARLAELEKQPKPVLDESLAPKLAQAEQAAAKLQQQLQDLQSEKADLEKWAQTLEKSQEEKTAQAGVAAAESTALKEKLAEAEKRFAEAVATATREKQLTQKLSDENKTLAEKAATESGPTRAALNELTSLRQQFVAEKERSERWMKSSQSMTEKAAEESGNARKAQAALAEAKNQLALTEKKLAATTAAIQSLHAELDASKTAASRTGALEGELTKLRASEETLNGLREDNNRLTARIAELEKQPKPGIDATLAPRLEAAQTRVAALEKELEAAQQQTASLTAANEKISATTSAEKNQGSQALAAANLQITELRGQLATAQKEAAAVAALRDQNTKLSTQLAQLEAQPKPVVDQTLEPRLAEAQQKVATLENELRAAQQRVVTVSEQVNGLRGELELANQSGAQGEDKLAKALATAETFRTELDTSKSQLTEAQKELYTLRQTAATANVLRSENMRLSGRIADLEKQAESAAAIQSIGPKLAEAQTRIAALEQELLGAQQQASGSGANLEELKKQLASAQERATQSAESMTGLRNELAAAQKTSAEATALRAELSTLRASAGNVVELREENARLAARLLDVESKPKAAAGDPALAQQFAQAQQQLRVLTDKAAADRTAYIQSQARVASLEADLRIQQRQNTGNSGEFDAVKQQLVEANSSLEKANADLVKLQSELVAVRESASTASTLKEENTQLLARIAALENQPKPVVDDTLAPRLAQSQQRIATLESELTKLRQEASASAENIGGLQKQLDDAQQTVAAAANLRTENNQLSARVADLEKRPAPDQTLAPRLAEAQAQVKSANERISALENDLRVAQRNASGSATGVEDLRKQLAAATQSLEKSQANVTELTALNSRLEKDALSSRDAQQRDLTAVRAQVTSLQRELTTAKEAASQAEGLREESDQLRIASADAVTLRQENARLTARVAELQNQSKPAVDDTLAPRLAQAQTRIASLESSLRTAQQSAANLDTLKTQLEEANQALEKSSSNVAELTALNDRLEKDIATARESSQRELAATRTQMSDLQRQLTASQQASTGNATLRDEVVKLRAETAGLATLRSENERLRASATAAVELRAKVDQLTRENEQVTGFMTSNRRELDQAQAKVADLEKQIAATRASGSQGAEETRKLQADLTEANQTVEKLTANVAELTGINDRLEQDLESAKKSVSAALAAQAQAMSATQPDAYKMEIRTLTSQIKDLETQLETDRGEAAKEFASLASQLQRARETNRSLSEANRSLMSAKQAEIPTVNKDEFDQLQSRVRDLVTVGDDLRRQNQRLGEENQRAMAEQGSLRQQLDDARKVATVLPGLADEKAALQERLEATGAQLVTAQREIEALQRSGSEAATRLAASQQTAQRTAAELAALRARATDAEKAADSHSDSVAELTDLNTKLEAEREDLRRQIVAARAENARISQSVTSAEQTLQSRIKDLTTVGEELRRQNQKLTDDNRKASEDQSALRQQLEDARKVATVLPGLADEKAALQERLEAVGTQLATAQRENDTLRRTGDDAATRLAASQQATQRAEAELATLRARATEAEKAADTHNSSVAELTELNSKLETERDDLRRQIVAARAETTRIAQTANSTEQLKAEADRSAQQNIDALTAQLAQVRRELQTVRDINTRAAEVNVAQERERAATLNQLRQENSALVARLAQAQGTLDQIASAARLATPAAMLASGGNPPANTQSSTPSAQAVVRYHTVTEGDSLSRISLRYYGTANRWQDIFQANREVLQGSNTLRVGTQLRIP